MPTSGTTAGGTGAEWPDENDCLMGFLIPMVDTCAVTNDPGTGVAGNLVSLNLRQWPSLTDPTQTGEQVREGYPSFLVANTVPQGLSQGGFGWSYAPTGTKRKRRRSPFAAEWRA